jgi:hypothetical protein
MAGGKRTCVTCGDSLIGRAGALYCSPAHRKRAQRARSADKRDAAPVTVTAPVGGHCPEALALLQALDEELAENSADLGLTEAAPLGWSAAESAVRELIADAVDRRVHLQRRLRECGDDKVWVKIAAEIRLIEQSIARLLKQVSTELPPVPSMRSQKASRAANARWRRGAS